MASFIAKSVPLVRMEHDVSVRETPVVYARIKICVHYCISTNSNGHIVQATLAGTHLAVHMELE